LGLSDVFNPALGAVGLGTLVDFLLTDRSGSAVDTATLAFEEL